MKGSKGSKKLFQKNKIVKQQEQQQYFSSLSSRLKIERLIKMTSFYCCFPSFCAQCLILVKNSKSLDQKQKKNLPAKFPTLISNPSQKKLKIPVFTLWNHWSDWKKGWAGALEECCSALCVLSSKSWIR